MFYKTGLTILSTTLFITLTSSNGYAKEQSCANFEKYFQTLAKLEKKFSALKWKKSDMEGARTLIKKAGTDLLDLRIPLVALDPQSKRPNHPMKCRTASEKFIEELSDAQKSLAELQAFGPMLG